VLASWASDAGRLDGGSQRIRSLAHALTEVGWDVAHAPVAQSYLSEGVGGTSQILGRVKRRFLPAPSRSGSLLLQQVLPTLADGDLVITSIPPLARSILARRPGLSVWVDFHDTWSDLALTDANLTKGIARRTALLQARALRQLETEVASSAVAATFAGYDDMVRIGAREAYWLPTPTDIGPLNQSDSSRKLAGFIGNFAYPPNLDALANLGTWLPRLTAEGWRVAVAGYGSEGVSLPPTVERWGPVPSIEEAMQRMSAVLVPVRRGGGIKVKAVEALVSGRPVWVDPHVLRGFAPEWRGMFTAWGGSSYPRQPSERRVQEARRRFGHQRFAEDVSGILTRIGGGQ
jgi:hypothetical protein